MAGCINKATIIGHLGADPETRISQAGTKMANFNVATSESWRDKTTGERRERTEWHRVVIFSEGLADVAEQYLRKGSKVYIEGKLQTRKWQDQSGHDRWTTEIVLQGYGANLTLLDRREGVPPADDPNAYGNADTTQAPLTNDLDDEVPF